MLFPIRFASMDPCCKKISKVIIYWVDGSISFPYLLWTFSKSCAPHYIPINPSRPSGRPCRECVQHPARSSLVSDIVPLHADSFPGMGNHHWLRQRITLPRRQAGSSDLIQIIDFFENPARFTSRRGFCFPAIYPLFSRVFPIREAAHFKPQHPFSNDPELIRNTGRKNPATSCN